MMTSLLEIRDLTKWYFPKKKSHIVKAVDGVSFSLDEGQVLGIIGESGCGKSTLGKMLVALEEPTKGTIKVKNETIESILKENPLQFRRDCQMIFQNPFDTFDPRENVLRILTTALNIHCIGNSKKERVDISMNAMEDIGMKPARDYIYRYPHELSGGQLQRISIVRSMLLNPKLIIADEPVSMLDISVRADIINLLLGLTEKIGTAMIFISHDIASTRYISDKVGVMYLGRIVEMGYTDDVIHNPKHPYTKVLISNCASINPLDKRNPIKIKGEPPTPINTGPGCYFYPRCYKAEEKCKREYPTMTNLGKGHYASCFYLE
jgi:oligopeptide/dipeptide ABC transporter ATP-binding protein